MGAFFQSLGKTIIAGIVILIVIILYSPKGLWELLQFAMRRPRPSTTS